MTFIKFDMQSMTAKDHEYIWNSLTGRHHNIKIENNVINICSWEESSHNGDVYDEIIIDISLPSWLNIAFNATAARQVSREIATINSSMQNTFNALIVLNKLLESK